MAWSRGSGRTSTARWKRMRRLAKHSLNYWCARCGAGEPLELDHIINTRSGGSDDMDNLRWLCVPCHKAKTQQEAAARRGKYRRQPKPPLEP